MNKTTEVIKGNNQDCNTTIKERSDTLNIPKILICEYLQTPVKSKNDKKEYRVIQLPNGLTALLIADVEDINERNVEESDSNNDQAELSKIDEKMAACALCVGVGSFSDPPEIPGLAHFLEHMVFMGSEKYPSENEFSSFITMSGGLSNATTGNEKTTFYFAVTEKYLYPTLDRFAQFFIAPLMLRDAISREREAVDSEFQMCLSSDINRINQLFGSFSIPNHPYSKFTWGNSVTLRDNVTDENLYKKLHEFRERYYSAHRMTLAVQAPLPLDTLENYVKECFSSVPSNKLPFEDFSIFKNINCFDTPAFRRIYKIKPIQDTCRVDLTWSLPLQNLKLYKSKSISYAFRVLNRDGKGSLKKYLKNKMWCIDLSCSRSKSNSTCEFLCLSVHLTDQGHVHLKEVIDAIFSYIKMISTEGPQKRIFDEIYLIENVNFKFVPETSPINNVQYLSQSMQSYNPENYIIKNNKNVEYMADSIKAYIDILTPKDVNIIILDKKFDDSKFDKVEPWFKTKYTDEEIPADWIESWKTIEPLAEFHLPEPNIFIPDDFTLIPAESIEAPVRIHHDELCEIWYKPDAKFRVPECYMDFHLVLPAAIESPHGIALCDLLVNSLYQLSEEILSSALEALISCNTYLTDLGLEIIIFGYNQKLPLVLEAIFNYLSNISELITENSFQLIKQKILKNYYNMLLEPSDLSNTVNWSIIALSYWMDTEIYAACKKISFDEFKNFAKYFKNNIYIQSLIQGNMTSDAAKKNVFKCIDILKCHSMSPSNYFRLRGMLLPKGVNYCRVKNFNPKDSNSVVANYYQSGVGSMKLSVMIDLLMNIVEEPLFDQLRTKDQLGYKVSCQPWPIYDVFGYIIEVCTQADKFTVEEIDDRIEEFLKSFIETLDSLSDEDFEKHRESFIKIRQCANVNLWEEAKNNWWEIFDNSYMFDRATQEINEVRNLRLQEFKDWFKDHIAGGSNFRKLSIQVVGTKKTEQSSNDESIKFEIDEDSTEKLCATHHTLQYLDPNIDENGKSFIKNIEQFKSQLYTGPNNQKWMFYKP